MICDLCFVPVDLILLLNTQKWSTMKLPSLSELLDNSKRGTILSGTSWNVVFYRNSIESFDCWTFRLFETFPGCQA